MQDVKAKKQLGQHFLNNLEIAHRIANSFAENPTAPMTLEIGPGMGVLTQFLLDKPLRAIEIDAESIHYLHQKYPQLEVIEGDFLKLPIDSMFPQGVNIIGNFPYNISSQIFFKVLEHKDLVPQVVGMLQREVAKRIAATPTGKEYGILSVLLQAYYNIEYLFEVTPDNFDPAPKVQSAVIRMVRNDVQKLDCDEVLLKKIIKGTFNQRRKTLRNSLRSVFNNLPPDFDHPMLTLRPERLSVAQFVELTNLISKYDL